MSILVWSNNGRIHLAEKATKSKNSIEHTGYLRKLCDGQWVSDKKKTNGDVTCPVCKEIKNETD